MTTNNLQNAAESDSAAIAGVAEQVREFVTSGRADSALAALRAERDSAVTELRRAQELDPNKLRRTVSI